ncbi:hypothetical protein AB0425_20745 [Actinosynnema sp. NPDC051121]|nr:hypothetical protein [Saccharothrix sp.]
MTTTTHDPRSGSWIRDKRLHGAVCAPGRFEVLAQLLTGGSCDDVAGTTHTYVEFGRFARPGLFCLRLQ